MRFNFTGVHISESIWLISKWPSMHCEQHCEGAGKRCGCSLCLIPGKFNALFTLGISGICVCTKQVRSSHCSRFNAAFWLCPAFLLHINTAWLKWLCYLMICKLANVLTSTGITVIPVFLNTWIVTFFCKSDMNNLNIMPRVFTCGFFPSRFSLSLEKIFGDFHILSHW